MLTPVLGGDNVLSIEVRTFSRSRSAVKRYGEEKSWTPPHGPAPAAHRGAL